MLLHIFMNLTNNLEAFLDYAFSLLKPFIVLLNFLTIARFTHRDSLNFYVFSSYWMDSLYIYQLDNLPTWLVRFMYACIGMFKMDCINQLLKPLNLAFGIYLYPNALSFFLLSLFSLSLSFRLWFMYIADILYVYIICLLIINNMFGHVFNAFKPKCTSLTWDKHVFNYF